MKLNPISHLYLDIKLKVLIWSYVKLFSRRTKKEWSNSINLGLMYLYNLKTNHYDKLI
jgi:hypothetical protein